jgi:hypothetical protein
MYTQPHRLQLKLEKDARHAGIMREYARVVPDAVRVRV